jgi:Fe-S-cluster containining protein
VSSTTDSDGFVAEDLCLACGLCCNGAIFARVKLQPEDDQARLRALGLPLVSRRSLKGALDHPPSAIRNLHLLQPCSAFDGCRCRIYAERPLHCRRFECLLLKAVKEGRTQASAALRTIRAAREANEAVLGLLRALGDTDEQTALSVRFRRVARRLEKRCPDPKTAQTFGELTLAVHEFNMLLSQHFYPGQ